MTGNGQTSKLVEEKGALSLQLPKPRLLFPRDRDPPRDQHLELICGVERVGVVEGVGFDLRLPKLDPMDWVAESLGRAERDRRRRPGRPFLWFPWYGPYAEEIPKREASRSPGWRKFSDARKRAIELEFTPEAEVRAGEIVSLRQSELIDPADYRMRDVLQDDSVRLATLQIKKVDGTVEIVETPLRFFRRLASSRSTDDPRSIVDRIDAIVNDAENGDDVVRLSADARETTSIINSIYRDVGEVLGAAGERGGRPADRHLGELVNMSIRLGRLLARADAATTIEPLAERHERSKQGAAKGGKTRRKRPWIAIATDKIIEIRRRHPEWSQAKVADDVRAGWNGATPRAPGYKKLVELVSELERAGVISPIARKRGKSRKRGK
jgi:hypothetical protein